MPNLIERAQQYADGVKVLTEWLGSGAITVSTELAQNRANICIACPKNVKDWMPTEAMASAMKRQLEIKKKLNLKVSGEKKLHLCSGCGCANKLKIWLPLRNILPEPEERANFEQNHCWLLVESEP